VDLRWEYDAFAAWLHTTLVAQLLDAETIDARIVD